MYDISLLLRTMVEMDASDMHFSAGMPPLVRKSGKLVPLADQVLSNAETQRLAYSVMNEQQKKRFEQNKECDFSFGIKDLARFRANAYIQRGCVALALRLIPREIRPLETLGLPKIIDEFCDRPQGLVLVCGATGSGKSTTLAAMIDRINKTMEGHILTIEDPIEFAHRHNKCLVNQREIGADSDSFENALRSALRQDPDVVLIGEMRDLETMRAALSIAETGHLTFATLHTNSAVQSINRIVDAFPAEEKESIRAQLGFVLEGVICQTLLPKTTGGRVLAYEIMNCTIPIKAKIRRDEIHQIQGLLEVGTKDGQMPFDKCLKNLYDKGVITLETALGASSTPENLQKHIIGG